MKNLISLGEKRNGLLTALAALAIFWMLAMGAQPALAQDAKLDLSNLDKLASKASEVTNVNLEGPMLQMAAEMMSQTAQDRHLNHSNKDPRHVLEQIEQTRRLSEMLKRLKGVYVRTYEFSKE